MGVSNQNIQQQMPIWEMKMIVKGRLMIDLSFNKGMDEK